MMILYVDTIHSHCRVSLVISELCNLGAIESKQAEPRLSVGGGGSRSFTWCERLRGVRYLLRPEVSCEQDAAWLLMKRYVGPKIRDAQNITPNLPI